MSVFESKLPELKTSIFTEMSLMASEYDAINLSQGFPEFDTPEFLKNSIQNAIESGKNQYAPSIGLPSLLEQVALLIERQYATKVKAQDNITITSGATEALWGAIHTLVRQDDEVIIFDPAYDSYEPAVELAGGICRHVTLNAPDYQVDWDVVSQLINKNTRAIIINTPHNPTGTLLSEKDLQQLQNLVVENELYVISDEVYEFMTFDNFRHESVLRYPKLFERAFVVSSFGKTYHCTGWKVGYICAPKLLTQEFRKIHQYVTFSTFTPAQIGISSMLQNHPQHITELSLFYQEKRDILSNALKKSRFKILPSKGTYFLLLDYQAISNLNDIEFCHWLTKKVGVAAIPLSPFYKNTTKDKVIRLCFAKNESTLLAAAEKLCQL